MKLNRLFRPLTIRCVLIVLGIAPLLILILPENLRTATQIGILGILTGAYPVLVLGWRSFHLGGRPTFFPEAGTMGAGSRAMKEPGNPIPASLKSVMVLMTLDVFLHAAGMTFFFIVLFSI